MEQLKLILLSTTPFHCVERLHLINLKNSGMASWKETLNFFIISRTICAITACLVLCFLQAHGGLLNSNVRRNKNFHYVVQRFFDSDNEIVSSSSSSREDLVASGEKGTATLVPSPSFSSYIAASPPLGLQTAFTDCGSAASIKKLMLSPCVNDGNSDICEIERGSTVTFNLSFVPNANATELKAVIHGIVDFVPIPFPSPEVALQYTIHTPYINAKLHLSLWLNVAADDGQKNVFLSHINGGESRIKIECKSAI